MMAGTYTIPYLCILFAAVVPYVLALSGRIGTRIDVKQPRVSSEAQTGWRKRSYWAHLNAIEAFAPFAVAVVLCRIESVPSWKVSNLALAFVGLRILHAILYLANRGTARFFAFVLGCACTVGIFLLALAQA